MSGAVNTTCEMWQKISSDGKDLINRLLQVNYKKRITPFEALAHEWILKVSRFSIYNVSKNGFLPSEHVRWKKDTIIV